MPVRSRACRSAAVLVATLTLGGCAAVETKPPVGVAPLAPRPTYAVGQRWIRSDGVWGLRYVSEAAHVFQSQDRDEIVLSRDLLPRSVTERSSLGRTFASRKSRALNVDDQFPECLTQSRGRALITASRAGEVSVELAELGHGLFTYYLVVGLRGAADRDRDSIVTLQELYQYVTQQVSRRSRAIGVNQHAVMKGELEGLLPLVKVGR